MKGEERMCDSTGRNDMSVYVFVCCEKTRKRLDKIEKRMQDKDTSRANRC